MDLGLEGHGGRGNPKTALITGYLFPDHLSFPLAIFLFFNFRLPFIIFISCSVTVPFAIHLSAYLSGKAEYPDAS